MADETTQEIRRKFAGKWKLARSENFDEFLTLMGVNFMARKMAGQAKPENVIAVDDDGTIHVTTSGPVSSNEVKFKLNQEFQETSNFNKKKFKNVAVYENGRLRVTPTPMEKMDGPFPEYTERELTSEGEMLMCIKVNDLVCKRWFKKAE